MDAPHTYVSGRMLIDGELVESAGGQWLESINPADESPLGRVPQGTRADIARAVDAAERAQPGWGDLPMARRVGHLEALADAIRPRLEAFAQLEALDTGNTIGPMRSDAAIAIERIRYATGLAYEIKGETVPSVPGNLHMTIRVPYGVVGRIVPFNHPLLFAVSRMAAAAISGNTVVLKPAEQSPLSASMLAEICAKVLPAGVVNIVTGGRETGDALVRDPRVKRIGFIGSPETGRAIQKAAAETSVKHVSLELGGKNPLIAFADVDPEAVASAAVAGMNFGWQGQSCGSMSRILLHRAIYDDVASRIVSKVSQIRVGHPLDPAAQMGPINSHAQYQKVVSYVALAQQEGAKLLVGGRRPDGAAYQKGYWFLPTVFGGVDTSMRLAKEEVFGPVMSLLTFESEDEAVRIANATELGLTAAIFTRDIDRMLRVVKRIHAGYVWVNTVSTHYRGMPFGGFKNSGIGREESLSEILSYTEEKAINIVSLAN